MKCIYYLAPTLSSTETVSDDLHEVGVKDFYLHVVSSDESGLKQHHLHSSNYFETLDILRDGFIGAAVGFVAGLMGIGLLMYFQPFGPGVRIPSYVYVGLVAAASLFGAWVGGLTGIESENNKLKRFRNEIVAGKYLILVYVRKYQEATVRKMMKDKHADTELVAIDSHFINPFSRLVPISEMTASRV